MSAHSGRSDTGNRDAVTDSVEIAPQGEMSFITRVESPVGGPIVEKVDLGPAPVPRWTVAQYRQEFARTVVKMRFQMMILDVTNLVILDCNRRERDSTLRVWQRRLSTLMKWCVGMLFNLRFAIMPARAK